MSRKLIMAVAVALLTAALVTPGYSQTATPPLYATAKVEGTDNVYIFRYGGHQSMFVVTQDGVIATDPISLRRPAAKSYIEEIQKITKAPIKYVIYSHSHLDKPIQSATDRFSTFPYQSTGRVRAYCESRWTR